MSMRDKIAGIIWHDRQGQNTPESVADAILATIKASVPGLVWEDSTYKKHDGCVEYAETENGTYFICYDSDDFTGYYCDFVCLGKCTWFGTGWANSKCIINGVHDDDLTEIKAAAQKHHVAQLTGWMDK